MSDTSHRPPKQAFTLVELLVALAIVALLTAIITPAVIASRRRAQMTPCISNLRQIGQAFQMYLQDNEGPPSRLHLLHPQYVTDARLLTCPLDRWTSKGGLAWQAGGRFNTPPETWKVPVSYFYFDSAYPRLSEERETLTKAANRPGYVMCMLHGTETPRGPDSTPILEGTSVRLCLDGSVIERPVKNTTWPDMLTQ